MRYKKQNYNVELSLKTEKYSDQFFSTFDFSKETFSIS